LFVCGAVSPHDGLLTTRPLPQVEHDEKASSRDSFSLGIEKLTRMADPPPSLFSPRSPGDCGVNSPRSQASFLSGAATARRSSPERVQSPFSLSVEYTAASPMARETIAVPRLKLQPPPAWEQQSLTPPPSSSSSSLPSPSSQEPPQPVDASISLAPFDSSRRPAPSTPSTPSALEVPLPPDTLDGSTVAAQRSTHSPLRVGEDGTRYHKLRPHSAAIFPPFASSTPSSSPPRTPGRPIFSMHAPPDFRTRPRPLPQPFLPPAPSRVVSRSQSTFAAIHPFYPSHDVIAGAERTTRIMLQQSCVDRRAQVRPWQFSRTKPSETLIPNIETHAQMRQASTYGARGFVFRDQEDEPEDSTQRFFFGKGGPDTLYWQQVLALTILPRPISCQSTHRFLPCAR